MALLNRVYDYELLQAIRAGSREAADACQRNIRYQFAPDWSEQDQNAFFLTFWIFERMEDREAYYHEYVKFLLRQETRAQVASRYLNRVLPVKNPSAVVLAAEEAQTVLDLKGPMKIGPMEDYIY